MDAYSIPLPFISRLNKKSAGDGSTQASARMKVYLSLQRNKGALAAEPLKITNYFLSF